MLRVLARYRIKQSALQETDLDDLLQEVWLEADRQLASFEYRGAGSLHRWLATILHFKLLEASRQVRKAPHTFGVAHHDADDQIEMLQSALRRSTPSVSQPARQREMIEQVCKALDTLTEDDRSAILARVYEGKSNEEAGRECGLSPKAFSKRYLRALERLRPKVRSHFT